MSFNNRSNTALYGMCYFYYFMHINYYILVENLYTSLLGNSLSFATSFIASFLLIPSFIYFNIWASIDKLIHSCFFSSFISSILFPSKTRTNSPLGLFLIKYWTALLKSPLNISSYNFVNSLQTAIFLFPNTSIRYDNVSAIYEVPHKKLKFLDYLRVHQLLFFFLYFPLEEIL